jgi:hypothetical protein
VPRKKKSSTEFLADYVDANTSAPPPPEHKKQDDSDHGFLEDYIQGGADTLPQTSKEAQTEEAVSSVTDNSDDDSLENEQKAVAQNRASEKQPLSVQENIQETINNAKSAINPAIDKISAIKTVGGIGALLAVLLLLVFVVVQVNAQGNTRLQQIWYMVNGRTTLSGRVQIVQGSSQNATAPGPSAVGPVQTPGPVLNASSPVYSSGYRTITV